MFDVVHWIEKRAKINPNRIAVIIEKEQITYKMLQEKVETVSAYLHYHKKVNKGDRVAILSHNRLEYVILLFAVARLEAIVVPLNVRLNFHELKYQINDTRAKLLFAEEEFGKIAVQLSEEKNLTHEAIESLLTVNIEEHLTVTHIDAKKPFIISYTSGTTGKPKGAVLTQENMYWNAINNVLALDLTAKDRSIVLLPLFHIGGIGLFALPTLFVGGTIIIPGKFEPKKAIAMIEKDKATVVMGVPSIHQSLIDCTTFNDADLSSVRWFYSGGSPCPLELIKAFTNKGFQFGQGFGLTETSPTVFMLSEEDARRKMGSIGQPVMYCDFRIIDDKGKNLAADEVGHLIVKGPNVFKEYWRRPEETVASFKGGWFYTGDLARIDDEGFVYIVGREKEMIISGGENIYPLEIEHVIEQLDEINEVAVVGKKDEKWGETPIAFISKDEKSTLTEEDIIAYSKKHLAKYKIPKEVRFLKELPKNATGKIQKNKLLE